MKLVTPEAYETQFSDRAEQPIRIMEIQDVCLPERAQRSHKYSCGQALIIGGAEGYTGAPALAANACERSGAGLTRLLVPRSIYTIAAVKCDGAVVTPLEADTDGGFSEAAAEPVLPYLELADVCLIGPGLGRSKGARQLVLRVLREAKCPVILDADALTLAAGHLYLAEERGISIILTPHEGEFKRIGGELTRGRIDGALSFCAAHPDVILVLKGHGTITGRSADLRVNPTGSAALAKGGTGDVLAGMICALLAQGLEPLAAAQTGVYLHGLAGDLAAETTGPYSLSPSDLVRFLPSVFRTLPQAAADSSSD